VSTGYAPHWEADVLLADGGTVHIRPIRRDDAERLVAMHGRLSEQTIRYRFFAPHPKLSPREVERFTSVDHNDRVALVAVLGCDLIAVGRYDRLPGTDVAEVAFVVEDAHHGRGLGSVLLEHLAAIATERGISRFEADVLAENTRMVRVFLDAGYEPKRSYDEDVVHLTFPIEPTAASLAVMQSREHRAEARSIGRLLSPRSVAVVGASRDPHTVGHEVFVNLLRSGFQGPVYPVNPNAAQVASVRAYPSVGAVPDHVDLVVIALHADGVGGVVAECARKGVRGLVVMSGGFSDAGPTGAAAERALVATARANGMRVIGPNCLGVINTAPDVALNATLAPALPRRGRVGLFSQSGALGIAILESVAARGFGLSTFVSAGNRADVSGNDLLQYWEDDPVTDVVLLYLESFGNARKFARLARRLGRRKPVVVVKSGRTVSAAARVGAALPDEAVDALFRHAGVIRVDTLTQLFDVAQVLTRQPLPGGRRVAVVGNSRGLGVLAADACAAAGLEIVPLSAGTEEALRRDLGPDTAINNPLHLGADAHAAAFERALGVVLADPAVDAVVTVFIPPLNVSTEDMARVLTVVTDGVGKPVVSTYVALSRPASTSAPELARTPALGPVPTFPSPEIAVQALARAAAYQEWRTRPEGRVPALDDVDPDAARTLVETALAAAPDGVSLSPERVGKLLAAYGLRLWPVVVVTSADAAAAAASQLGYPVALKATAPAWRHRPDLGTVRLDIGAEEDLRAAYDGMAARLDSATAGVAVQSMAPPGVPTVVAVTEDPSFGALLSFGLGGVATDLLGDRGFRTLPLTDLDAAELVRSVRAAPLLFGHRGSEPVDVPALEAVLLRVARLADDLPEVADLELNPVVVSRRGASVLNASVRLAVPGAQQDAGPRRMR
jgi:acyl-CoA synthetase (NDP forming)/GNAT superfamily N-acetyltransferase